MSLPSTALRSLRGSISHPSTSRLLSTYSPPDSLSPDSRPPRPLLPTFFTGRPTFHASLLSLESSIKDAQTQLRKSHIYPLPTTLPPLQPERVSWKSASALSVSLKTQLKTSQYRKVTHLLNELHQLRYIAKMTDEVELVGKLDTKLSEFERADKNLHFGEAKEEPKIDEWGRSYGMGRRKESSARVWVIPTTFSRETIDQPLPQDTQTASQIPSSEILVNHLTLPLHFPRTSDREIILRPLKITGLLGAFNVFALVRGGGTTGQAGAIALGLARALVNLREETKSVLESDGALMRDPRMVERKKTGRAKARKANTWVKR
ncbi:small subunit ribosomal protein S9, partial [Tremellales sp. Uapishka_1]